MRQRPSGLRGVFFLPVLLSAPAISRQLQLAGQGSRQHAADERLPGKRALIPQARKRTWLYIHSDARVNKVISGCKHLQDRWLTMSLSKAYLCQQAVPDDTLVCISIFFFFFFPMALNKTLLDRDFSFSLRFFSFQCAMRLVLEPAST